MKLYQKVCIALGVMMFAAQGARGAETINIPTTGTQVVPGEWTSNIEGAKAYAAQNGLPLLVVWSNSGCTKCLKMDRELISQAFVEWRQDRKLVMLYIKNYASPSTKDPIMNWVRSGVDHAPGEKDKSVTYTQFPFVLLTWVENGVTKVEKRWVGQDKRMPVSKGTLLAQFIDSVEKYLGNWAFSMDDPWDPDDDTRAGAQELAFEKFNQSQAHTLKVSDTNDWFTFAVAPGTTNRVSFSDVEIVGGTGTPRYQLFEGASGSSYDSGAITDDTLLEFENDTAAPKTYFLRAYYASGANVDIKYTINYKEYVAVSVWFDTAAMTFNAADGTFDIPVVRGGDDAALGATAAVTVTAQNMHARYTLETVSLDWTGVEEDTQYIVVTAAADDAWIGVQDFTLVLTPAANETVAPFDEAVITIDPGQPKTGMVGYVGYVLNGVTTNNYVTTARPAVREGDTVTVLLSRTGGSNMAVTAGLTWGSGASAVFAAEAFWDDTEDGVIGVDITIPKDTAFRPSRDLTLTITPITVAAPVAKGTALTFRIANEFYIAPLSQFAAQNKALPLTTTSDAWFVADGGSLRSRPLANNAVATMTAAVTGPGVLRFAVTDGDAAMLLLVGKAEKVVQLGGDVYGYIIPSGKQTITLSAKGGAGGADYAVLSEMAYVPLTAAVAPTSPRTGDVVPQDVKLIWDAVGADQLAGINGITNSYTVFAGATEKAMALLDDLPAGSTSYDLTGAAVGAMVWRVGIKVQETAAGGASIALNGAAQKITVAGAGAPAFDMDAGDINPGWTLDEDAAQLAADTFVGVRTAFGPFAVANASAVKVKSGALPKGMALMQENGAWWVTGFPQKDANNARVVLQAMNGKTAGITFALNYTIKPLPREAYGTFNGKSVWVKNFLTPLQNDALGMGNMTVSAAGKISGKITTPMGIYTFSAAGYDMAENGTFAITNAQFGAAIKKGTPARLTLEVNTDSANDTVMAKMEPFEFTLDVMLLAALYRDGWADKTGLTPEREAALRLVQNYETGVMSKAPGGYYTIALPINEAAANESYVEDTGVLGTGYLTLTVDKKGKVKASGKLANGASASMSSTLLMVGTQPSLVLYTMPTKASYFFAESDIVRDALTGRIQLDSDTSDAIWDNRDPRSSSTGGICLQLTPVGGWYGKKDTLRQMYPANYADGWDAKARDWEVSVKSNAKATGFAALPTSAAENPAGLKLSVNAKTGILSGSFSETVGAKKVTRKVQGILTPTLTNADATGISGFGFYLVPQTTPYKFNQSGNFLLVPDCGCGP
ncbi:MAG: thioredoxin family protein [Kiritimatiellaeota bacterium]|nr:thioredoxin family protein [Kiritimatiellota bacterium]